MKQFILPVLLAGCAGAVSAQTPATPSSPGAASPTRQQCAKLADANERLACYDRLPAESPAVERDRKEAPVSGCHDGHYSSLSRFWELESGSNCGRFNIRGYRPIAVSGVHADTVNTAPSSPTPGHTATEQPYLVNEMRLQLSIRTKVVDNLMPGQLFADQDSLWFAYTQQSYWQLFTSSISRPFRNTDHEPEFIYIMPANVALGGDWRWRYTGLSLNHQSNGQSLPLSRSWNRAILMAGLENGDDYTLTARLWNRITDGDNVDDNPDIEHLIGRGELTGTWNVNKYNTLMLTLRHSLTSDANGSWRLEWLQALGDGQRGPASSGLRLHVQLFGGYGDSLVDYNRWRNFLSIGLSLVDW